MYRYMYINKKYVFYLCILSSSMWTCNHLSEIRLYFCYHGLENLVNESFIKIKFMIHNAPDFFYKILKCPQNLSHCLSIYFVVTALRQGQNNKLKYLVSNDSQFFGIFLLVDFVKTNEV